MWLVAKHILRKQGKVTRNHFFLICFLIMGTPLYSFFVLFFSNSTDRFYGPSLFILFFAVDIIRVLILILVIPSVAERVSNIKHDLSYYTLAVITVVVAILHFGLYAVLSRISITTIYHKIFYDYCHLFICLRFCINCCIIAGRLVVFFSRYCHGRERELVLRNWRIFFVGGLSLSISTILSWIGLLFYTTYYQQPILRISIIPFVVIGIVTILFELSYSVISCIIIKNLPKTTATTTKPNTDVPM